MPTMYRAMWVDDGKPRIGQASNCLGVRVPPVENPDIEPIDGMVEPGMGGMSVAPHWTKLPPYLIPKDLEHIVKGARAKPAMRCFRFGNGAFVSTELSEKLSLRVETKKHGLIEPSSRMSIDEYQTLLAETRDMWTIDESP